MTIKLDLLYLEKSIAGSPDDGNIGVFAAQPGDLKPKAFEIDAAKIIAVVMNSTHDYCEARPGIRKPEFKSAK